MSNTNLLLYSDDDEFRKYLPSMAGIRGIGSKDQVAFSSLDDMAKAIGQRQAIDQLVIYTHGYAGGLALEDGKHWDLNDKAVVKAFANVKTKVNQIRFEGCWVGENPVAMAFFGHLLSASTVSGYTWMHVSSEATVTIPPGADDADLECFWRPFWRWVAPYPTLSIQFLGSLAHDRTITKVLQLEWYMPFENDLDLSNITPPFKLDDRTATCKKEAADRRAGRPNTGKAQDTTLVPHGYKRRSDAKERVIEEKDAATSSDPASPFEYVTVRLQ
jgi:hypothetical protein